MVLLKHHQAPENQITNKLMRPIPEYNHSDLDYMSSSPSFTTTTDSALITSTTTTDDTLSMISTPWSTDDSWDYPYTYTKKLPLHSWHADDTSSSVMPISTSSYGVQSPDLRSTSKITLTVLSNQETPTISKPIQIKTKEEDEDISTWTMESFTSTGLISTDPLESLTKVKVKYPWSPRSCVSDLDLDESYPNSVTLVSQKGSRESIGTYSMKAIRENLTPMNCALRDPKQESHPFLDWILVKRANYWVVDRKPRRKKNSKNN